MEQNSLNTLPEEDKVTHIIVGDPPTRNPVQKWVRDVWGLSQDAEHGNLVVKLVSSNIAALANNIRKLREHIVMVAKNVSANGDDVQALQIQVGDLERRLSYYERNNESLRYHKQKLDRITEAERQLAGEPSVEPMCPLCEKPILPDDLVQEALTSVGPLVVHVSCLQEHQTRKPDVVTTGGLVDAGGNAIKSEAQETSQSLSHMAEEDGEGQV